MKAIFPVFISVILVSILEFSDALFILANHTESLQSRPFSYPDHVEQLDIIWRFDHSIHLDMDFFELDGQSGDFLLISDLPLTFEESFEELNGTADLPSFLSESIITNQGLLLSWKANVTIDVLSDYGTFIYFHAEYNLDRGMYPYKGFNITVQDLDLMRTPPPVSTTEPTIETPEPAVAVYISKFLSCNEPRKFLDEKDIFKHAIAEVATEYCRETIGCMEYLEGQEDFNYTEVNIPTGNGLHYCDPLWDVYMTCVEVTFAIVRVEGGQYVMPAMRLEEMWSKKSRQIRDKGYCPYIPPKSLAELNSWVWIAAMLGLTLILVMLFCMTWLTYSQEDKYHRDPVSPEEDNAEERTASDERWIDRDNPVYSVLAKIKRGNEETKYLEMNHSQPTYDITDASANNYKTKVKKNELYQEQEVTFQYENPAFGDDDGDEIYGHGNKITFANEDNQSYGQTLLRIPRNEDDGLSDTSI